MARPSLQNLNRAPGITSGRQQASPGVAVQAPIDAQVGPNSLQGLAEILGVGAEAAISEAAKHEQRRVEEETEALATKAESDFHGGVFDEETYKKSRTYRKTHDTLAGARQAVEGRLSMRNAVSDFVTANPYADEAEVREQLEFARLEVMFDDEGNVKPAFQNERVRNIVEAELLEEGYEFITKWRGLYTQRMQTKALDEAEGLFIANARAEGTTTLPNMDATATQMRALGATPEDINTRLANSTIALARETLNPELLDLLPQAWTDGSLGPMADAETASRITQQRSIVEEMKEAGTRKNQWGARYDIMVKADEFVRTGQIIPDDMVKQMRDLGFTPEAVASLQDQAVRTAIRVQQELEEAREAAEKDDREFAEWQASPFSFTKSKSEEILGKQYDAAMEAGNIHAAWAIVRQGLEANALPRSLRNKLNRVPPSPEGFADWHREMVRLDKQDDQVFSSLKADARFSYHAYNGLMALGKFSHEQAYLRLQQRDPARGSEFVKSREAVRAIDSIAGDGGSIAKGIIKDYVQGFASLTDIPDAQVLQFAKEAFEKDYFVADGFAYPKSHVAGPKTLTWMKKRYAADSVKLGIPIEWDDVIVAPIEGSSDLLFRDRRDPTRVRILPVADLQRMLKQDQEAARKKRQQRKEREDAANRNRLRSQAENPLRGPKL